MSLDNCISDYTNNFNKEHIIIGDDKNAVDWSPGVELNLEMHKHRNITKNWQYRKYIMKNADKIIKQNQLHACQQCVCPARYESLDVPPGQKDTTPRTTPYLYDTCISKYQPPGYEESLQKKTYIIKQDLQSRMTIPSIRNHQLIQRGVKN